MTDSSEHAASRPALYRLAFGSTLTVETQADARATLAGAPDAVVVVRRHRARAVLFKCPDGCGDVLVINVDASAGRAWRLREEENGSVTLMPSVWRSSGCCAHFILWRSRVWWCRYFDDDGSEDEMRDRDSVEELWPAEMDAELRDEWRRIRAVRRSDP